MHVLLGFAALVAAGSNYSAANLTKYKIAITTAMETIASASHRCSTLMSSHLFWWRASGCRP
jgi:hypothetical protein